MHFTESELQRHEEEIITRALAEIEADNVENLKQIDEEHEKDLAEKDREIAAMMAHNAALGQSLSNTLQREKVLMDENKQLMAQAVLFAKATISDMVTEGTIKKAQAFLKEHRS